jgi:hypothetical protein
MARDRELQDLVDRADAQRRGDAERAARVKPKPERPAPKPRIKLFDFMRAQPGAMSFWWWPLLTIGGTLAFFIDDPRYRVPVAAFAGLFAVRLLVRLVQVRIAYARLLRFPGDCRIPVTGWTALFTPLVDDCEQWRLRCGVAVNVAAGADRAVVTAALTLFAKRATGWQYGGESFSGSSGDIREKWRVDGFAARGSANIWVVCEVYQLVRQLERIAPRIGGIEAIALTAEGSIVGVSRPSVD